MLWVMIVGDDEPIFVEGLNSSTTTDGPFLFPRKDGVVYNGVSYSRHALERMAPCTSEVLRLLIARADDTIKARVADGNLELDPFKNWWDDILPEPRGISPTMIEFELHSPGMTGLCIIASEEGLILTVYRKGYLEQSDILLEAREKVKQKALKAQKLKGIKVEKLIGYLDEHGDTIYFVECDGPKDKRTSVEKLEAARIEKIVSRRAKNVRGKALELNDNAASWDEAHSKMKKNGAKSVDIKAWKDSKKHTKNTCVVQRKLVDKAGASPAPIAATSTVLHECPSDSLETASEDVAEEILLDIAEEIVDRVSSDDTVELPESWENVEDFNLNIAK